VRKIITGLLATAAVAAVSVAGDHPPAARAACNWNIAPSPAASRDHSGNPIYNAGWQSNGWKIQFRAPQIGSSIHGRITTWPSDLSAWVEGDAQGAVTGNAVHFTVTWNNGTAGVYDGTIDADGFVSGTTHDRWNPRSRADWHLAGRAKCS
jgi:hypothetical protein